MQPAIRHAARGFAVTPYLADCVAECARRPRARPAIAAPVAARRRAARGRRRGWCKATTPRRCAPIAAEGAGRAAWRRRSASARRRSHGAQPAAYHHAGRSRRRIASSSATPIRGSYRGYEIVGPPPPASSGVHVIADAEHPRGLRPARRWASARADALHLLAEALKIAFADRAAATADPAFVDVPVARLIVQGLCRRAPRRHRPARAPGTGCRRRRRRGSRQHHPPHRRRRRRQRRRHHADHQQPVRRPLHRARHRHDPEQLHVAVRPAARPRAVDRAGQARHHLDVADDRAARRQAASMRSACRAACASSARRCRR